MPYYRYTSPNYYRPSLYGGFRFFPPVIKFLLVSNVAVFFLLAFFGLFRIQGISLGSVLNSILPLYPLGEGFQVWQLFTYMFMHGGVMHLFFNMFALWMFGMELENFWGSRKFAIYYMLCGLGAGFANLFVSPLFGVSGPTVGASGAIYGVLLAFGVIFPDRPILIYFLLPIKARYFVLMYILLELYAGVTGTADGVAHFAHLGGAAVGLVYLLLDRQELPFRGFWSRTTRMFTPSPRVGEYSSYRKPMEEVSDAKYYDLHDEENRVNQQRIDEILDKISQNGYQGLTEEEKKILFEASKKLN